MKISDLRINQLIEIVVSYDEKTEYLPSRIEEIKDQYLYISMPMRKGALLPMRLGEEITVVLRLKTGMFGFVSKIVGRRRDPIPYLIISKPERFTSVKQKREFVRLPVNLPVRFRIADEENPGEIQKGTTVDISAGGVLFYSQADMQEGQKLEIEIYFSDNDSLGCLAQVVRVFERGKHEKNAVRVAVVFDDISESQRDRIFKFIFKKQREWIKKGVF